FTISLRGNEREVTATDADYAAAGIKRRNPDEPALDIVRLLAHKFGGELFLSPPDLLRYIEKEGMEHLFRLDGWRQPDSRKNERPSRMSCFQDLVKALGEKAKTPPESCGKGANTQWTRWIEEE
ncbi:MAG TPA: hypothetical protein VFC19_35635, partial [Candidatus Limnocylindrales bacterium]|nr:hypothetical protein [Candidatus Limnocylindrales bacterium]